MIAAVGDAPAAAATSNRNWSGVVTMSSRTLTRRTDGFDPDHVAAAFNRRPEAERPSLYFVAFDIEASRFARVKDAGALVLGAANAKGLNSRLDALRRGNILLEK